MIQYMSPLVSIIVPLYNVEMYVGKCIKSLINQSYENIQIILVDDGSHDRTLQILRHFELIDKRIKVLNQANNGVSSARNLGLENSSGEYVVFVDGDDFLAPDFVDYMLNLALAENADFVLSKNCFSKKKDLQIFHDVVKTISATEATSLLLSPRIIVGCWNKMFKKSFIDKWELKFSSQLFYGEGLDFIVRAAQLAKKVTVGDRRVYYYRRNNENSATSKFDITKYVNGENAILKIESELKIEDSNIYAMLSLHKSMFCVGALSQVYAHNLSEQYKKECKRWKTTIYTNFRVTLKSKQVSLYRKLLLVCGFISPSIVSVLDSLRRKYISKQSVI